MKQSEITQGAAANRNGKMVEESLVPIFRRDGFDIFSEKSVLQYPETLCGLDKYILTDVKYTSIYGSDKSRTEYLIVYYDRRIRVEVKFQVSNGSVDEKYPYVLLNAIDAFPENEVILIVDGGGYKPGARQWLQDKIDEDWLQFREKGKNIKLMTVSEFISYFSREFGH